MRAGLKKLIAVCAVSLGCTVIVCAHNSEDITDITDETQYVIPPLFQYVEAPDDLPDLQSRTDYLMDHFWDPFDFKNTKSVDQNALNHAFNVYVVSMQFASPKKVEDSLKKLIGKIKNNPGLSFQFAKAAEENLYGPRAELWGDPVYIAFAENAINNKKIRETQKKHFEDHLAVLKRSTVGSPFPSVKIFNKDAVVTSYRPAREFAIFEFTPPSCEDGLYSNLKLDISGVVNNLIDEGRLEVNIVVIDDKFPEGSFPDKWNIYYSPTMSQEIDLRTVPSFYVIGKDGKIIGKNLHVDEAINLLESLTI